MHGLKADVEQRCDCSSSHSSKGVSSGDTFAITNLPARHNTLILVCVHWGKHLLVLSDVWDERNGLLWAQPFDKVNTHLVGSLSTMSMLSYSAADLKLAHFKSGAE